MPQIKVIDIGGERGECGISRLLVVTVFVGGTEVTTRATTFHYGRQFSALVALVVDEVLAICHHDVYGRLGDHKLHDNKNDRNDNSDDYSSDRHSD